MVRSFRLSRGRGGFPPCSGAAVGKPPRLRLLRRLRGILFDDAATPPCLDARRGVLTATSLITISSTPTCTTHSSTPIIPLYHYLSGIRLYERSPGEPLLRRAFREAGGHGCPACETWLPCDSPRPCSSESPASEHFHAHASVPQEDRIPSRSAPPAWFRSTVASAEAG